MTDETLRSALAAFERRLTIRVAVMLAALGVVLVAVDFLG